ncbi:MAG TPA: hypothetical protein PLX90_05065 [Anaerolineales bacterium]|nr:hypothetical protein [Anaerolineales bacterium]
MKFSKAIILFIFVTACSPQVISTPTIPPTDTPSRPIPTPNYDSDTQSQASLTPEATVTKQKTVTATEDVNAEVPSTETPISNDWMNAPILPEPTENVRAIYEYGQTLGNNPNAFSIFGDCQARPDEFFGRFETDEALVASLTPELGETVNHFYGSFNRESPTAQDGTTPGALLWDQWHRGEYGCTFAETPVDCELRIQNPSFVIIQIGSHFESRNTEYLRRIITQLIDRGVVPILATKADNRELDFRINRDMYLLAQEFDLPLWNFWASLSDLPNRGLYTRDDRPLQGDIYLIEEAQEIQRQTGLEALDIVWRYATGD